MTTPPDSPARSDSPRLTTEEFAAILESMPIMQPRIRITTEGKFAYCLDLFAPTSLNSQGLPEGDPLISITPNRRYEREEDACHQANRCTIYYEIYAHLPPIDDDTFNGPDDEAALSILPPDPSHSAQAARLLDMTLHAIGENP